LDVNAAESDSVAVTLSASQQTILHRKWHTWWHLLWIIPLFPTGTEYQTIVTKEGNITDAAFYNDFFAALEKNIAEKKSVPDVKPASDVNDAAGPDAVPAAEATVN
jgi:hypothetical protein